MMGNGDTVDDHLCSVQFLSMIFPLAELQGGT